MVQCIFMGSSDRDDGNRDIERIAQTSSIEPPPGPKDNVAVFRGESAHTSTPTCPPTGAGGPNSNEE